MSVSHANVRNDANPADDPIARLIGLATAFEISLAALNMQIAVETGAPANDQSRAKASATAIQIVAFRQKIRELAGAELMPDSGLDVALELFSMQVHGRRMSVMDVCAGLKFPHSTTRRWLQKMELAGLVDRQEDLDDHRRDWVSLRPSVCETIRLLLGRFSRE